MAMRIDALILPFLVMISLLLAVVVGEICARIWGDFGLK